MHWSLVLAVICISLVTGVQGQSKLLFLDDDANAMSPAFNPNTLYYTSLRTFSTTSITLIYAQEGGATVVQEGGSNLQIGENVATLTVTSGDGLSTTKYYIIIIRQPFPGTVLDNAVLTPQDFQTSLAPSNPDVAVRFPGFNPNVLNYTINLAYNLSTVSMTYTMNNGTSTLSLLRTPGSLGVETNINNKLITHNLDPFINEYLFAVSVENDVNLTTTYVFNISRALNPASLKSLVATPGTILPSFNPAVTSYTVTLPFSIDRVSLSVSTVNPKTTFIIAQGTTQLQSGVEFPIVVGVTSVVIFTQLTNVSFVPTETLQYVVTITRNPQGGAAGSDSSLFLLDPAVGSLVPTFDPTAYQYSMEVSNAVDKMNITVIPGASGATLLLKIPFYMDARTVATVPARILELQDIAVGFNTIEFNLTSSDKTTNTAYFLEILRVPSSAAALGGIELPEGQLVPPFQQGTTQYLVLVPTTAENTSAILRAEDPRAKMSINGQLTSDQTLVLNVSIPIGSTSFFPSVIGLGGNSTQQFNITFVRRIPPPLMSVLITDAVNITLNDTSQRNLSVNIPWEVLSVTATPFQQIRYTADLDVQYAVDNVLVPTVNRTFVVDADCTLDFWREFSRCFVIRFISLLSWDSQDVTTYQLTVERSRPPWAPCTFLNFCNQNGECQGLPPVEVCECYTGWSGLACEQVEPSLKDFASNVVLFMTLSGSAVVIISAATGAGGGGYIALPFFVFLQMLVLPISHNVDMQEIIGPFETLNWLNLNTFGTRQDTVEDGVWWFGYSHNLMLKLYVLGGVIFMTKNLIGQTFGTSMFYFKMMEQHFAWIFILLVVPVTEAVCDLPEFPRWVPVIIGALLIFGLWAWALGVVRHSFTKQVRRFLLPGQGWGGFGEGHGWKHRAEVMLFFERIIRQFFRNLAYGIKTIRKHGILFGIYKNKAEYDLAMAQAEKERLRKLGEYDSSDDESEPDDKAVVVDISSSDSDSDDGLNGKMDPMKAKQQIMMQLGLDEDVDKRTLPGYISLSEDEDEIEEDEDQEESREIKAIREEMGDDPEDENYIQLAAVIARKERLKKMERPPFWATLGEDDPWKNFRYRMMFMRVCQYYPLTEEEIKERKLTEWQQFRHYLKMKLSPWFQFIELTYIIVYVVVALVFDGPTQWVSLCGVIFGYLYLVCIIMPYRTGNAAITIATQMILLIQLYVFSWILRDRTQLMLMVLIIVLQGLAMPVRVQLQRWYHQLDELAIHHAYVRREITIERDEANEKQRRDEEKLRLEEYMKSEEYQRTKGYDEDDFAYDEPSTSNAETKPKAKKKKLNVLDHWKALTPLTEEGHKYGIAGQLIGREVQHRGIMVKSSSTTGYTEEVDDDEQEDTEVSMGSEIRRIRGNNQSVSEMNSRRSMLSAVSEVDENRESSMVSTQETADAEDEAKQKADSDGRDSQGEESKQDGDIEFSISDLDSQPSVTAQLLAVQEREQSVTEYLTDGSSSEEDDGWDNAPEQPKAPVDHEEMPF